MSEHRKFKGVFIAKKLWLSKEVSWMEKCIIAEIDSLSDEESPCTASREYLAKMFDVSVARISNIVSELKSRRFLEGAFARGKGLRVSSKFTEVVNIVHENREVDFTESVKSKDAPYKRGESSEIEAAVSLIEPPVIASTRERASKFVTQWQGSFYEAFGYRCVVRKVDEKTVAAILLCGISETELLDIAKRAWKAKDKFWCQKSVSLSTFCARLDEIRNEINKTNNSRNGSAAPAVTDYAAAAKRKAA